MKIFKYGNHILNMDNVAYIFVHEASESLSEKITVDIYMIGAHSDSDSILFQGDTAIAFLEYIDALAEDK